MSTSTESTAAPGGREAHRHRPARVGAWSILGHRVGVEAMCRLGVDFLGVDAQHGFFSFDGASVLVQVANLCSVPCLVRVPAGQLNSIPRYLDAGADGIVVAMVETAEQAREAVELARYQPAGRRSYGGGKRNGVGDPDGAGVPGPMPEIFAMIETAPAIAGLADIAAVEGLAGLFVGPVDLGLSLGGRYPVRDDDGEWLAVLRAVVAACELQGIRAGMFATDGEDARRWLGFGFGDVVLSSDIALLRRALHEQLELARRTADASGVASAGAGAGAVSSRDPYGGR